MGNCGEDTKTVIIETREDITKKSKMTFFRVNEFLILNIKLFVCMPDSFKNLNIDSSKVIDKRSMRSSFFAPKPQRSCPHSKRKKSLQKNAHFQKIENCVASLLFILITIN